jgi:hypothetical protein
MSPTFPFLPPVLVTESADEQAKLYQAVEREMMAMGFIDAMYVASIVSITLEIARYEACKVELINMAMRQVLQELKSPPIGAPEQQPSDCVEVSTISRLQLSECHIQAEAIRRCAQDLVRLNGLIDSLEMRRTRLECFACRSNIAKAGGACSKRAQGRSWMARLPVHSIRIPSWRVRSRKPCGRTGYRGAGASLLNQGG